VQLQEEKNKSARRFVGYLVLDKIVPWIQKDLLYHSHRPMGAKEGDGRQVRYVWVDERYTRRRWLRTLDIYVLYR
jgi:hypothetical protein